MKVAYYGGFRMANDEEDVKVLDWATKKLNYTKEVYPELFLD